MTMFLHGGCKGIHCLGDAGYLSTYRPICWGGEKVPTFDPPKLGDRPPTGEIIDPLYQSLLLLQLPSLRTQPLWPLLRIFDDTPAVGCKDWRCQLLNWLSRHAVCRRCEEWMTLEKRPLEGNKGLWRWIVISSDAAWRVNVGGVQTLQFLNLDGLLHQRLSTTCRRNSSTTRTAENSPKYPVTHNAVKLVEPQLTQHWLNRLCTYCLPGIS